MVDSSPEKTLVLFNKFIARAMGLHFREGRLSELEQKITAAAGEFGYDDPEACMLWLMSTPLSQEQLEILARSLTIGETYFFRDPQSYRVLEDYALPELIKARRNGEKCLRIWSAGCSSGEEPYSIAILLSRILSDPDSWNIMLLATDINPRALERAQQGVYSQWSFRDAPPWLMDYFKKRKDGRFEIIPRIRKMVQFDYLNLAEDSYPSFLNNTNAIDIIFCRNVMLYFEPPSITTVITKFNHALLEGGWLFVSPTEVAHGSFDGFTCQRYSGALVFRKGNWDEGKAETWMRQVGPSSSPVAVTAMPAVAPVLPGDSYVNRQFQTVSEPVAIAIEENQAIVGESPKGDAYREACAFYEEGRYELAADKAREFLANRQESVDALELLAKSYASLGRFAEARQCCEEAIAADRLQARNHYLLSIILTEQGQKEEAVAALKRALYIDHDFLLAYFALGNLNRQEGRKNESQRNFANALRLLERRDPHEVLPEAEGMTAGRLVEIIRAMS